MRIFKFINVILLFLVIINIVLNVNAISFLVIMEGLFTGYT